MYHSTGVISLSRRVHCPLRFVHTGTLPFSVSHMVDLLYVQRICRHRTALKGSGKLPVGHNKFLPLKRESTDE